MKLISAVLTGFLGTVVAGYGSTVVIDNFTCPDSVSETGSTASGPGTGFNSSTISCPGSIGGEREDFFLIPTGPDNSVSTMNSNPPTGAITGTFGSGITEYEGMVWGNTNDLNLNLVGDSILVQIKSDAGGTLNAALCTSVTSECNGDIYSAIFAGSSGYQDVLIPLTGTPTVLGSGGNVDSVNIIDLYLSLNTPGSTWTINGVDAVATPEPSTLLLTGICFLSVLIRSFWRRQSR